MTINDLTNLRLLEIKMIAPAKLESICSQPRPDGQLGLRWDDARYALSLRRAPRRPY